MRFLASIEIDIKYRGDKLLKSQNVDDEITPFYFQAAEVSPFVEKFFREAVLEFRKKHKDKAVDEFFINIQAQLLPLRVSTVPFDRSPILKNRDTKEIAELTKLSVKISERFPTRRSIFAVLLNIADKHFYVPAPRNPFGSDLNVWEALEALFARAHEALTSALILDDKRLGDRDVCLRTATECLFLFHYLHKHPSQVDDFRAESYYSEYRDVMKSRNAFSTQQSSPNVRPLEEKLDELRNKLITLGMPMKTPHALLRKSEIRRFKVSNDFGELTREEKALFGSSSPDIMRNVHAAGNYQTHGSATIWPVHVLVDGNQVAPIRPDSTPLGDLDLSILFVAYRYSSALMCVRPNVRANYGDWFFWVAMGVQPLKFY